ADAAVAGDVDSPVPPLPRDGLDQHLAAALGPGLVWRGRGQHLPAPPVLYDPAARPRRGGDCRRGEPLPGVLVGPPAAVPAGPLGAGDSLVPRRVPPRP